MSSRKTIAKINLNNLSNNFKYLKSKSRHPFLCCMVKANAYGHGDIPCVEALIEQGCSYFGVALVEEGMRVRKASSSIDILLFGSFGKDSLAEIFEYKLTPVVFKWSELMLVAAASKKEPIEIHLKFNIGMNRLGFSAVEVERVKEVLKEHPNLKLVGICGHLPSAENLNDSESSSLKHKKVFKGLYESFKDKNIIGHLYNSAGLLAGNADDYGSRIGIALYGADPYFETKLSSLSLKPVMNLYAEIIQVREVLKNDSVSYNETWVADKDTKVAVLAVGYADGFKWSLSNSGTVLINNQRCKILGRVCMDYVMVDVSHLDQEPKSLEGKLALLFGDCNCINHHPIKVAKFAQTIAYDLFTSVSFRVQRDYTNG